jgi:CheY-like chemotaxis protein
MKSRVLIVDDEKDFLRVCKLNLEATGKYEVLGLPSAENLLDQVKAFKPQVILLDLLMPMIQGFAACSMIRSEPATAKVPVIIVSALEQEEDIQKAFACGATDYLRKPVSRNELLAKIEQVIGKAAG